MFNSIFSKTLHEKRWMMLGWGLGVFAMSLLMMGFYHSFSDGNFDELVKSLPGSMKSLIGDLAALKTVPGYVSQQVYAFRIPLLTIIMSTILYSGLLAGDEGDGQLQVLLTKPVSRSRVVLEKYFAGLVVCLVVCFGSVPGVLLGLTIIKESMSFWMLAQAALGCWLVTVAFGSVAYGLGAISGKRGQAGSIAGVVVFVSYLITSFVTSVSGIEQIEKLSLFHYYNKPSIAEFGLELADILLFLGVMTICIFVGMVVFSKRDIHAK